MKSPIPIPGSGPEDPAGAESRPRLYWYLVAATATMIVAVLVAGQTYLSMLHHGHSWWRLLTWQALSWSFWALLAPSIVAAGGALHRRRRAFAATVGLLAICAALTASHVIFSAAVTVWIQPYEPVEHSEFLSGLLDLSVPWILVDVLVFWLLIASGFARATSRKRRWLELRESRLEGELAKAQLHALQLELQPHFLFNTLNSIAALVRKRKNDQALEMLLGLSHLLRMTLDRSGTQLAPLRDELSFVRRYVDVQRQRFQDRLTVTYVVEDDCLDLPVPTLLLQPLVENAIRHGVSKCAQGAAIEIGARLSGGEMVLTVVDTGPGLDADFSLEESSGVGLSSTCSRLEQLYGSRSQIELSDRSEGGTVVTVRLPIDVSTLERPGSSHGNEGQEAEVATG